MKSAVPTIVSLVCLLAISTFGSINTEGQSGLVRTFSAKTHGLLYLDFGLGINYAQDNSFLINAVDNKGAWQGDSYVKMLSNSINLSFGVLSCLDIAGSLPVYYDRTGFDGGIQDFGIGDFSISAKLLYPPPGKPRLFYQSYFLAGTVPTGQSGVGIFSRHTAYTTNNLVDATNMDGIFYTTNCFTLKPMMLWTFDIGNVKETVPLQIHFNLGGIFASVGNRNNVVVAGLAAQYSPVKNVQVFLDFNGQSRWDNYSNGFDLGTDPLLLSPGIKIKTPVGVYIQLAGDFSLLSRNKIERWKVDHTPLKGWTYQTYVHPKYGFAISLGWNGFLVQQDDDHDGIVNEKDRCPKDAEDMDGFEDGDGCPDLDNDNDGFDDLTDKCPNDPEDKDGYSDTDGCPELDNDGDGITDVNDQCPLMAEDFDTFQDTDGCPDYDNDKDGIADSLDKCPTETEDIDGFADNDGCADPDNDKDGIIDLKDKCPKDAETMNGYMDDDGCPDTKPEEKPKPQSSLPVHQILEGVTFISGNADIAFNSFQYIDPIIQEMRVFPEIQIEIRGHTDGVGKYEINMALSQKRAEAVRLYIIKSGIEAERIKAIGYGPSSPIADNRTASGRLKNRRIEVIRIK